jgi:flavin reductase (DIM6/NTAB) family NADH-FMN oxidoreductase RutF
MDKLREIPLEQVSNIFGLIGHDWMLITAAKDGAVNTMTASWGCAGVLWNRPVAICFIRHSRYTFEFAEAADTMSLSFFGEEYRPALNLCGRVSGRDCHKFAEAKLTPVFYGDTPYVEEARMVLICRKLYADDIKEGNFIVPRLLANYPTRDFHRFYILEVKAALLRE